MKNYFDELLRKLWKCYESDGKFVLYIGGANTKSYMSTTIVAESVEYDGSLIIEYNNDELVIDCISDDPNEKTIKYDDNNYMIRTSDINFSFCFDC